MSRRYSTRTIPIPMTISSAEFRRRQKRYYAKRRDKTVPESLERFLEKRIAVLDRILGSAETIVEVCCGRGYLLERLSSSRKGRCVLGFDISEERCREAKERGGTVFLGDVTCIPLSDEVADLVFGNEFLHHVHHSERRKCLLELMRIVKPGGTVIMIEPNRFHPLMILAGILLEADRGVFDFSLPETVDALREAGAEQISVAPFNCFTYPSRKPVPNCMRKYFYVIEDLLEKPVLAASRIITARKAVSRPRYTGSRKEEKEG
ncbi:MAG: class I SAM-dependent methyltransferase [Candidatus Hydrogenedentota bacterium]|nr:MAG: class I SAM-dependent methyltransferase [Candidatus Hydrogenedentota bacterium]